MVRQCVEISACVEKSACASILVQALHVFGKGISHTVFSDKLHVCVCMRTHVIGGWSSEKNHSVISHISALN